MKCVHGLLCLALVAALGIGLAGDATAAEIVIVNNDGAGEGFNDPTAATPVGGNWGTTVGQQRLIAFEYAAGLWAGCLESNVTIEIIAQFDPQFCSPTNAVLGSAGATTVHRDFTGAPQAGTWYPQALANSLAGVDLDGGTSDINATFNSNLNGDPGCLGGTGWYYGLDQNPGSDIDFVSVLLHEMAHGLGFQTFVSSGGVKFLGFDDHYMIFLENHGAVPSDYPSMTDGQRAAANIADPNLHWVGPLVTTEGNAILGGGISNGHVRMHGPNPYQSGSSVSHFSTALSPNELMEPSYTGPNHDPRLATVLMDEIGWTLRSKVTGCPEGGTVDLASPSGPPGENVMGQAGANQQRGVYFTAIKDFDLCSFSMEMDHFPGQTVTARLYAASGTTRGALLATGTLQIPERGLKDYFVPISYPLKACLDYNLTLDLGDTFEWSWWNENVIPQPYDIGGVIRVRDGELDGLASNFALPQFTIQGESPGPAADQTVLQPVGGSFGTCSGFDSKHGLYVTSLKTASMCALETRATIADSRTITARVYEAVGNVRGDLVAEGQIQVNGGGEQWLSVPLNAQLVEGQDYDFYVDLGPTPWPTFRCDNGNFTMPYVTGDGLVEVREEYFGAAGTNTGVDLRSMIRAQWNEGAGGELLDFADTFFGDPIGFGSGPSSLGDFVTANVDASMFSFGARGDFPAGATLTARVYNAVGNVRGSLVSEGTVLSSGPGDLWHDVPLAAELVGGNDYEFEMQFSNSNSFGGWFPVSYPVNAYGIFTINSGTENGLPVDQQLRFRPGVCTSVVTAAGDRPTVAPRFTLAAPYPNPISGSARIAYELDEAASVTVEVYDVKGRRVATVLQNRSLPIGPGELSFDGAGLASGVYFMKMSTSNKSVSRKITILR